MDEETRHTLERGRRVREVLKQPEGEPLSVPEQIAVLVAVTAGVFDAIPIEQISQAEALVREAVLTECPGTLRANLGGRKTFR